ncbi:MAG: hypothetical protein U9O98_09050 [Asgard group archaeon]|nr:hypothetical protein [Asgard group archaeon]
MVLPEIFMKHESRLSSETLEAIKFQFDRLGHDSKNLPIFFERFLKISQSPTIPPEDLEVKYLAAKIAYMLADYKYFTRTEINWQEIENIGAKIWYGYIIALQGEITKGISLINNSYQTAKKQNDYLPLIESLSLLAHLYHIRIDSNDQEIVKKTLEEITQLKEEIRKIDRTFLQHFLPSCLINSKIIAYKQSAEDAIVLFKNCYEQAKEYNHPYWISDSQLELANTNLRLKKSSEIEANLSETFEFLDKYPFLSLKAKAINLKGQYKQLKEDYTTAKKLYSEAKEIFSQLNNKNGVLDCLSNLAQLALEQDILNEAKNLYKQTHQLAKTLSNAHSMADALTKMGLISCQEANYKLARQNFEKALEIAKRNDFNYLLTTIYDGLSYTNFISGDFWSSVENRSRAVIFKEKLTFETTDLLIEHLRLGQLNAIIGNFERSFDEFETTLEYCLELNKRDELYFDVLNWLFEISTVLGKINLAQNYMGRADLFASIHDSEEENLQALIARIRFLIRKGDYDKAQDYLDHVFKEAEKQVSSLPLALAIIQKGIVLIHLLKQESNTTRVQEIIQTVEEMVFISLDLEYLPLTMFSKQILANLLAYNEQYEEAMEELQESLFLAEELGMMKYYKDFSEEKEIFEKLVNGKDITAEEIDRAKIDYLNKSLNDMQKAFWLVSASEYQGFC